VVVGVVFLFFSFLLFLEEYLVFALRSNRGLSARGSLLEMRNRI